MKRRTALAGVAACVALGGSVPARAQTWPTKPIVMIVPFAPGGGTDTMARLLADKIAAITGQRAVVENKPGASGVIATVAVQRAAPDGHTVIVTSTTTHAANPSLVKNLPYDSIKDFEAVAILGLTTSVLVSNPALPVATFPELVARARAQPGKTSYGNGNATGQIAGEMIKNVLKLDIARVPYRSALLAMQDTMAGHIDFVIADLGTALPLIRGGKLRALGVTDSKRIADLPDVPAIKEYDIDMEMNAYLGVYAPAKTPPEIVLALNKAINAAMATDDMKVRMTANGIEVHTGTPEYFAQYTRDQVALWARLCRIAGVEPE